jgi:RNA-binding protein YhbY
MSVSSFQIGKQGLTPGIIESLKLHLKTHTQIRISVLKSATRDKAELEKIAQTIADSIDFHSTHRIIGYTIVLNKLKPRA